MASGAPGAVPVPTPVMQYQVPPGQHPNPALRPYAPLPNGYGVIPGAVPQGTMQPPGGLFLPLFFLACSMPIDFFLILLFKKRWLLLLLLPLVLFVIE